MASKTATFIIAALYLLLGVLLFICIPQFNAVYEALYMDWNVNQSILIRAFHFPRYIWILDFGLLAGLVCSFAFLRQSKALKRANIYSIIVLFVLAVHLFDWLAGYTFCHAWGCTHFLPTWRLFK